LKGRLRHEQQARRHSSASLAADACHQWFIEPAAFRAADMRSAFAPFAASIAAHSSFEWQVRVGKFEPVTGAFRQIGFGFTAAMSFEAPLAVDWANPALGLIINAAAIMIFILRLPYVRGAYLPRVRKQQCGRTSSVRSGR
jgi:hypothetical protein